MKKAEAKNDSDWKDGFLFVGNHLALDFLNTRPIQNGEPVELLPDFSAVLRWFEAADLLGPRQIMKLQQEWGGSVRAQRTVDGIRELREKLREEVTGWEGGAAILHPTVNELNKLMADYPMLTRLKASGAMFSTAPWFEPHQPEDLFAPLAHNAAMLFADVDRNRVRRCAQCVLHFYDTSKKGTRQWCSMRLCGNRAKVAAYAARRRGLNTKKR